MPSYGPQCVGCGGEDCVCCSTYLEERASQRYHEMYGDEPEEIDEYEGGQWEDDEENEESEGCQEDVNLAEQPEDFGWGGPEEMCSE